jgi:homoserine kinase
MKRIHCDACGKTADLVGAFAQAPKGWVCIMADRIQRPWRKELCPECFEKVKVLCGGGKSA